eukprot:6315358-Amphidinium_carterae.1
MKQRVKPVASLQSGVPGDYYEASKDRWRARFKGSNFKACKQFRPSTFKTETNTWEEARAAALQAAIECRHVIELQRRKDGNAKKQARGCKAAAEKGSKAG